MPAQGNRGWRFFEADELAKLGDPRNLVGGTCDGTDDNSLSTNSELLAKLTRPDQKRVRCVYKEEGSSSCPNSLRDVE